MDCDQCHLDHGIKTKNKKVFKKAEKFPAEWEVLLNGAKMHLCNAHKDKLDRSLSKVKFTYTFKAREIERKE